MTNNFRLRTILMLSVGVGGIGFSLPASAQSFEESLAASYSSHPQILGQRSRLREIDESYIQARAQGLPTSSLEGQLGGTYLDRAANGFIPSSSDFGTNNSVGLTVSQPIYQGGRVTGLKSQAKSQILASRSELEFVEQNILLAAAEAYINVIRDEKAANVRRNNVDVLLKQLDANQTMFDAGDGTRTDIAQAETRLEESKKGLAQANANLLTSRAAFERVIGFKAENLSEPSRYALPATLEDAIAKARQNNPRLSIARHLEDAADAAIDVAKASLKPSLALNGTLQSGENEFSNFARSSSAAVTAQVRVPIYTGGLNRSRVRAAKEARIQRQFDTRDLEDGLDENVTQSWARLVAAREVLESSRKQVESAKVAFEGVSLERSVGTRTALDVLDAEQELLNAELSVINAERDVLFLSYQLLNSMGIFSPGHLGLNATVFDRNQYLKEISGKTLSDATPVKALDHEKGSYLAAAQNNHHNKDTMIIKANKPSWVEIKNNVGDVVLSKELASGESWMGNPKDDYTLSASNSGALELYIGSELMGRLGSDGIAMADIPMPAVKPEFMSEAAENKILD